MKICFISNYNVGFGLSGGDRIFIELMKAWRKHAEISLMGCREAIAISERAGVTAGVKYLCTREADGRESYGLLALLRHTCIRMRAGMRALKSFKKDLSDIDAVYSVSDFWPDLWPAYRLKKRNPKIRWIAGYYLFAPPPWASESPYRGVYWLRGLIYWLMQRPTYYVVKKYADHVYVTSEPDVARFLTSRRDRQAITVVQGGVDISESEKYLNSDQVIPFAQRKYDACFMGRFHYQKGILLLPEIWRQVCNQKSDARLAIIGNGALENELKTKIARLELENNIELVGFRDGDAKHEIFKNSKMMLHPSTYDSGGMAAAEGMAWGLPGISFDLEALKTYYPQGMLKVSPTGDTAAFAAIVLRMLDAPALHAETARQAHSLIVEIWDWNKRAAWVYDDTFKKTS